MSSTTTNTGANVLGVKDANVPVAAAVVPNGKDSSVKSMEYHRQVLQSKMEAQKYVFAQSHVSWPRFITNPPS